MRLSKQYQEVSTISDMAECQRIVTDSSENIALVREAEEVTVEKNC